MYMTKPRIEPQTFHYDVQHPITKDTETTLDLCIPIKVKYKSENHKTSLVLPFKAFSCDSGLLVGQSTEKNN